MNMESNCGHSKNHFMGSLAFFVSVAALGGFLFGFDTAVISGTIDSLRSQFHLSSVMEGWIVSSALLGCIVGAACAGSLSDKFGRKIVLIISAVLFLISAVWSGIPKSANELVIARFIGGLGIGMASMLSPLYISEFSPAHLRGRMVSLYQFAIVIGIMAAYFSNSLIVVYAQQHKSIGEGVFNWLFVSEYWRAMFLMGSFPAAGFLILMFFIPESPRWLARQGQADLAVCYLSRVMDVREAQCEIDNLKRLLETEENSLKELFKPSMRVPLIIGVLLPFFSQVTGINVIIYYGTSIFKGAGLGVNSAFGAQVLVGFINMIFTLIAIWKVDRFGRKPLLQTGLIGLTLILLLLGFLFQEGSLIIPILFCLHVGFFAMSLGPITWILISEIFPTKIRGRAMSIGTLAVWISCALVAQTFPWLRDNLGTMKTFFIYAACLCPGIFVVWFMVPETKMKTLEEIEHYWQRKNNN